MATPGIGNDINLQVGLDFSKSIQHDAPRAAAELSRVFNSHFKSKAGLIEPLGRINSSTSEFAKSLEAANARVIAFGASVGIIYNIQRAFTELVKTTIDVEKRLVDINVVLGVSKGSLKSFGDQLFSIANQTGKSFSEVADAALEFSRQGLNVTETLKRTKDALVLTRIAGIDAKDSVEALTAGVNSFTKTLIDTTQIVNKFAAVDAAFAVSSADLAESLKRVGSTAQDAGVDLDQLLGIVTAVQQTTSRGGAVIGNALKTIFTRISRGETIKELQALGVAIDEGQNGIEKLKALSVALNNVSDTQKAAIKEAAGGVYQINIVAAALGDLSKQYGIYDQALAKSQNATDEAISRNKELNTTLSALATQTSNNLTKAFSKLGNLTIDSPFRFILDELNKNVLEPVGKLGEEGGSGLAENILKGFSKFIQGPGLVYVTAVGLNLTKALAGFAFDAFKQLQNYNRGHQQVLTTQQGINSLLQQDVNLRNAIISGELKSADAQAIILGRLQQNLAITERIAAISSKITPGVIGAGIVFNKETGIPARKRSFFARGMIPTATEASREISGAYDGGYVPGNVKVRNIPGIGRVVYNDREKIKRFAGLSQPAIVPPLNSKAGKNYNSAFQKTHGFSPYSNGFVPNFVNPFSKQILGSFGKETELLKYIKSLGIKGKKGSSRLFVPISEKAGVKIALNPAGIAQNEVEFPILNSDYFAKQQYSNILPKGYGFDENNFRFGYVERLFPANSNVFKTITGKPKSDFLKGYLKEHEVKGKLVLSDVEEQILDFIGNYGLIDRDFYGGLNTGISRDGRLKLLDVGFNESVQNSFYNFRKGRNLGKFSNGLIPALTRESQFVPKSTIKIGQDARLKSSFNPAGLGVYNTIHEPGGLKQGISRAYAEGMNPKSYGVPNFADFKLESKFGSGIGSNALQKALLPELQGLLKEINDNNIAFTKLEPQINKLISEFKLTAQSASSVRGIFKQAEINRPGTLNSSIGIGKQAAEVAQALELKKQIVRGAIGGFSQFGRNLSIDSSRVAGLLGSGQPRTFYQGGRSPAGFLGGGPKVAGLLGYSPTPVDLRFPINTGGGPNIYGGASGPIGKPVNVPPNQRALPYNYRMPGPPVPPQDDYEAYQAKLLEFEKKKESSIEERKRRLQEALERNKKRLMEEQRLLVEQNTISKNIESYRRKIDSYNIFGGGRAIREAIALNKAGKLDDETLGQFRDIRRSRLTNAAGIGSFAIPTLVTPLLQQISDNKKYQAGLGLASDVTSSALTGFAISGGNPLVAAAGAGVGLLTSLPKTIEALTEPIPDLTDKIQKLQDAITKTAQNTSEYITITEKLNAIQSGEISGVKEGDIKRLAAERQKLFSQFDPQARGLISEANKKGDISELRRIEATVNRINNTRLSGLQVLAENKGLKKNLSFQGGLKDIFTKGGLDNPLVGGGPIAGIQLAAGTLGIDTGPTLGRSIQRTYANRNLIEKRGFFSSINPINQISDSIAATQLRNVISDSEIKTKLDDARQRSLASKSNFSQLTSFSNLKGESLFELISKDVNTQKQIAGAQSFSDISKSLTDLAGKNDIRGVNEFLELLKLIDPDPKSMELLNRLFKIQFSPQRIEQAVKDEQVRQVNQDKTNKLISESSISLIKFADSLERVGADLSILNSGKLIDLEKTFNLEKIKLNLENSIKGLNAGDYEKERLNLNQQNLSSRQSRDISIEKLRADTNEALLDKIQGFTGKIQTTFVRDQIKLRENAGPEAVDAAIEETTTKLKSFFDSVGLSNIDIKTFDSKKANEILESLKKFNNNTSKLDFPFLNTELFGQTGPDKLFSPDQINELKVGFSELASALTSVEQKFRIQEARITQEYKAADETTQAQFEANKKFLKASDNDRLIKSVFSNNLDLEQARRSSRFDVSEAGIRGIENFRLSNLAGPERFQEEFQINRRRIQAEFENNSGNLARMIAGRTANAAGGTTLKAFNEGRLNTKQQVDEQIKQLEKRNNLDEVEEGFLKNLLNIQEQIRKEQEELNITKDKGLTISEEQLKIDQMIAKTRFQEEKISDNLKNIQGRIRDNKPLTIKDFGSVINNQFDYGSREFKRDAIEGVNDVSATIKSSFSGAISSIIKEGKNFGDAFREMLIGVLNKIVDKTSDITTNLLFNGLTTAAKSLTGYANGGKVKGYSSGGVVRGGSGTKDDVPALLTEGEYIIKKSAAESIGSKILNEINYGNPETALLKLQNEYQYDNPKYPTSGKYAYNSALSNFALTDTDLSRQNTLKFERESRLLDYLEQKRQYDLNKANALKAFKDQKRNRLYGAYLSAAFGVVGAGLQAGFGGSSGSVGKTGSFKSSATGTSMSYRPPSAGLSYDYKPISTGFSMYNGGFGYKFGGAIKKYASGGTVFGGNSITDNVPAMLMAGEYVIKKDRVNKLGKPFFDSLNSGVKKYADGGIVAAQGNIATPNFNNSLIVPFASLTSAINNLNTNLSNKQTNTLTPQSNDVNNYISVSISIDGQNNTAATSSVNSQSRNNTKPDNKDNAKQLEKNFTAKMGEFLNKEMKQGGSIWTFVNSKTGR